jgi:hypothetical protein
LPHNIKELGSKTAQPKAVIGDDKKAPLFRTFKKSDKLTGNPMNMEWRALHDKASGQGSRPSLPHLLPYV